MKLEDLKDVTVGLIADAMANMHTVTVAKVTQVKAKTINCRPVMSRVVKGVKIDLPEFAKVPCVNLQGGASYLHMPIAVGDYCLLLISERCFDGWYNGQDFEKPLEYRMHDYSDSFAIIGINPAGTALTIPSIIEFMGDKLMNGNHEHNGNTIQTGDHTQTGDMTVTGVFQQLGGGGAPAEFASPIETPEIDAVDYKAAGVQGVSGTFLDFNGLVITVTKGIITAIV